MATNIQHQKAIIDAYIQKICIYYKPKADKEQSWILLTGDNPEFDFHTNIYTTESPAQRLASTLAQITDESYFFNLVTYIEESLCDDCISCTTGSYNREITICYGCNERVDGWGMNDHDHGDGCRYIAAEKAKQYLRRLIHNATE